MLRTKGLKWLPFIILLLFPLVVYWPLSLSNYWVKFDNANYFFPVRQFISDCYHHGVMPSWNPYEYLGLPVHADPQNGFWYPITWLIVITKGYDLYGSNIDYLLHFVIAGVGMFQLLRGRGISVFTACLFGMCYQGCGFIVSDMQCLAWVVSVAWLPLVLYYFLKLLDEPNLSAAVGTAFTMSMMLTGGYPAFFLLLGYLLTFILIAKVAVLLYRRQRQQLPSVMSWLFLAACCFLVMSSGYLYSIIQALGQFTREDGILVRHALSHPYTVQGWLSMLTPFAAVNNSDFFGADLSMVNGYVGLLPLLFACVGIFKIQQWQVRTLLLFGLLCLVAAMGGGTPFREFLYHHVPFMNLFRFSALFRIYFSIALFPIGAVVLDNFLQKGEFRKGIMAAFLVMVLGFTGLLIWSYQMGSTWQMPPLLEFPQMFFYVQQTSMYNHIIFQATIQLFLLLVLGVFLFSGSLQKFRRAAICIVVVLDVFITVQLNATCTVLTECSLHDSNVALKQQPRGFPIPTGTIGEWRNDLVRVPPSYSNGGLYGKKISGEAYNPFELKGYHELHESPLWQTVQENPLVYFQVDTVGRDTIKVPPSSAHIAITAFQPNAIDLNVDLYKQGMIIFQQTNYVGWHCLVDGKPSPIVTVNMSEMGVNVDTGSHTVRFEYKPPYLVLLMVISFGGILLAIIFLSVKGFKLSL